MVVANSAIIVFREGLEAVLILAAVTAPLLGSQRRLRRPIAGGVGVASLAVVATWFIAQAVLSQFSRYGDKLQAVTGLIAIGVLLVIMNWFFHKLYCGVVLVVMVGGSARTLVDVGWLPGAPMSVQFPDWWARWFELVPSWTTVGAQVLAALLVVGSYFAAEWIKVRSPRRRGELAAQRSVEPVSL